MSHCPITHLVFLFFLSQGQQKWEILRKQERVGLDTETER